VKKKFGADFEQLLRPIFYVFMDEKLILKMVENIVAFALKSCIE
jgi:hypothetical protein